VAGRPSRALKMPRKSAALVGEELGQRDLAGLLGLGQDHLAHRVDAVALEEHVLGAGQADAGGAEGDRVARLLGRVGVGADLEPGHLGAPLHQLAEVLVGAALLGLGVAADQALDHLGRGGLDLPGVDGARGAVDREEIALGEGVPPTFRVRAS
jgi:hypothetical protein